MKNLIVKKSHVQGRGVFANKNFKRGEIILLIDDSHVVKGETKLSEHQLKYDCDYLANGKIVIMQEPEKYINHSCEPSSYVKTINGVRHVIAMHKIKKGSEITYDYSINGCNDGTFKCNCGSKNCRITYQGNYLKLPKGIQLKYLPYLEDWFIQEHWKEIKALKRAENFT